MLRKFKVSNFKCFEEDFVLDLSKVNGYTFNPECVKNGIVNCAMIYGYNGMGKSNLGFAIFD
ncbi:ATP-binding protein, partial [Bacteroides ovatus]|nr:ATP-binding protein [Bacteroides ovatus]